MLRVTNIYEPNPMWFKAIFGLKINMEKSELILVGRMPNCEELASLLGCNVGSFPPSIWVLLKLLPESHQWFETW